MTQNDKFQRFRALHQGPCFVIPNPWDAGTARILAHFGFAALATTSAGHAFTLGKRDSAAALTRAEILQNAGAIAAATDLPTSADLENGFGDSPQDCVDTVLQAVDHGLVGGSIEDATGDPARPLYDLATATDRIRACAKALQGKPFVLTARAENYLWGNPDLADTITRLHSFADAGADVLYAPGLPDLAAIRTVCAEVQRPVNVLMGLQGPRYTVAQIADAGAARISVGGSLARAALGAMIRAATEIRDQGTFDYAADAAPAALIESFMQGPQ